MPEITAKYLGDLRVESTHTASGAVLLTDASIESQGSGENFSPVDLLAVSLGACAMTVMGIYAKNHGLDIAGASLAINKTMSATSPHRVAGIEVTFIMPERDYSDKDKKSLERAAGACPVHNSLYPEMEQRFIFKWAK